MVRFGVADIIARRGAESRRRRWVAEEAERYRTETRIERGAARLWRVTAPITLRRAGSFAANELVELQVGTSLRYECLTSGRDYWNGFTVYLTDRRFLVLDGEYAGARVAHTVSRWCGDGEDAEDVSGDPFPPAGLEAEHQPPSEPARVAQDHP